MSTTEGRGMESCGHHQSQRPRDARGSPPQSPQHQLHLRHFLPPHYLQNPTHCPASHSFVYLPNQTMEDDAISMFMDIDNSPLSVLGVGFLDEEDREGEMFLARTAQATVALALQKLRRNRLRR